MAVNDSIKKQHEIPWSLYAWSIIATVVIFQILRWQLFPMFMDIYYHLSVMLGFERAGGYVTTDFWEFAPIGRPHLYPPLLHILMLGLYKLGFSKVLIARLCSFIFYPLILGVLWTFGRAVFGRRFAFWTVVLGASGYYFYLEISNLPAFSLALILGILSLLALEKNKIFASLLLLVLTFYAHTYVAYLFLGSVFLYELFSRKYKLAIGITAAVCILSSPMLFLQIAHRGSFRFFDAAVLHDMYFNVFILFFALLGLWACLVKKQKYYLLLGLFLVFLSMLFGALRSRFLSGAAMVPVIFLGAAGIEIVLEKISGVKKKASMAAVFLVFVAIYVFSPTIFIAKKTPFHLQGVYSAFMNIFLPGKKLIRMPLDRGLDSNMYSPRFIDPLVGIVSGNSTDDEIIFSDVAYAAGMISVFSGRAMSCGMLPEVRPLTDFDQISQSRVVVWFKELDGSFPERLKGHIERYNLKKIAETDLAYVYKNPSAHGKVIVPKPLIPTTALFAILLIVFILIIVGILL